MKPDITRSRNSVYILARELCESQRNFLKCNWTCDTTRKILVTHVDFQIMF